MSGGGKGMCQNCEGELVVLHPHDRPARAAAHLLGGRRGEARVDGLVALPVLRPELEVLDEHVAEWPERAVREAEVEALDVGVVEPDAAQGVRRILGRDGDAALGVGAVAVAAPRAPPAKSARRKL